MAAVSRLSLGTSVCRGPPLRVTSRVFRGANASPAVNCAPSVEKSDERGMLKTQQALIKSLQDKTKSVRKLSKKIAKVPTHEKVTLALEMKDMISKMTSENDQLLGLAMQMSELGYEDPHSDSSSDEGTADEVLDVMSGGMSELLMIQEAQVKVCTGKACSRKGGSGILHALSDHWQDNEKVDVQSCSCLGMCKQASNLEITWKDSTLVVTAITPEILAEHGVSKPELDLVRS